MKADEINILDEHVATGIVSFDELLGGGIELGCITEIFGERSAGKSTLALQIIAAAQKQGHSCFFADTEFQFTPVFADSLGVDCSTLEFSQFRLGEETFDAIEEWAEKNKKSVIILDSMGGVLPREEAEKTAEGKTIGLQSRLMAAHCRKMIGLLAKNRNAYAIINHQVTNLTTGRIGSSGGSKLEFHKRNSVRLTSLFGKAPKRAPDGSIKEKYIQAELKKEKGMNTHEGKKVELVYVKGTGFLQTLPAASEKRKPGRPAKVV